jgi:hypothetical protein
MHPPALASIADTSLDNRQPRLARSADFSRFAHCVPGVSLVYALLQATACTFNATGTFVEICAEGYGPDKAQKECKVRGGPLGNVHCCCCGMLVSSYS